MKHVNRVLLPIWNELAHTEYGRTALWWAFFICWAVWVLS